MGYHLVKKLKFDKKQQTQALSLNKHAIENLKWCLGAIQNTKNNNFPRVDFEIKTDASETVWGNTDGSNPTWGFQSENDKNYHINYLELLALKYAVDL